MRRHRVLLATALLSIWSHGLAVADVGVAVGTSHVLVFTETGLVWAWGSDSHGQLAQGTTVTYRTPPVLVPINSVVDVKAGASSSYALRDDGHVWAWGDNGYGQLGDGTTTRATAPVLVTGLSEVVAIAAGSNFALALRNDGTVWAWGANYYGQLGDGTTASKSTPVQVTSLGNTVVSIAASSIQGHAVKADGTVWSWGYNASFQLGDGTTTTRTTPVRTSDSAEAMTSVAQIAAGPWGAFALTSTHDLWGWGANTYWQLADGTTINRSRPVPSTFAGAYEVQAGGYHTVALKADASVWAWGWNAWGQLGDGTTTHRQTPLLIAGVEAVAVASAFDFVVAVSADGRVWTWGRNASGQLGDGTTTNRLAPVQISDPGFAWRVATPSFNYVAGSYSSTLNVTVTCATAGAVIRYTTNGLDPTETDPVVTSGGTVAVTQTTTLKARAWKSGMGTSNVAAATYTLTVSTPWFSPAGGTYTSPRSVTISTNTSGAEIRYTLDGSTPSASATLYTGALQIGTMTVLKAIALRMGWSESSVAWATYAFNYGTLAAPAFTPGAGEYPQGQEIAISAQAGATIRYTTDGAQVTASSAIYAAPVAVTGTTTISAKAFHPDWTTSASTIATYTVRVAAPRFTPDSGTYTAGQTILLESVTPGAAIHYTTDGTDPTDTDPIAMAGVPIVACSCTIKARAFLAGWTPSDVATAVYTVDGAVGTPTVAAGVHHSMLLKPDGTVWTWGLNTNGQLGDGTTSDRSVPGIVNGLTGIVAIAAGSSHSLAVRTDGTVYAWGANTAGQLGDGTTTQRTEPVRVGTLEGVKKVAAGAAFSLALKVDGTLWAWGSNSQGQLGDGTTTARSSPGIVEGLSDVRMVAAGDNHTVALLSDGGVLTWGENQSGQLGDGTTTRRTAPVLLATLEGVASVGAGASHSFAVLADGTTLGWGAAMYGRLGLGYDISAKLTPTTVALPVPAAAVDGGSAFSIARAQDGAVWSWGINSQGQLGDGNPGTYRLTPFQLPVPNAIVDLAAGYSHTLAIDTNGSVWSWGANGQGQLGDGTLLHRSLPIQIADTGFAWRTSTPRLTPGEGSYAALTTVVMTAVTPGAMVFYTTDGSEPTTASPGVASGGTVVVDRTLTLKAKAVKEGMPASNTAAASYSMNLPPPTFSPGAGTYASAPLVTLQSSVPGATIHFTGDGSEPTTGSATYTSPVALTATTTLSARAFKAGWTTSSVAAATFTLRVATPTFVPDSGVRQPGDLVAISTVSEGATIRYTLDGTQPSAVSPVYVQPLVLDSTVTIRAAGFQDGWSASDTGAASYWVLQGELPPPTISPAAGTYASAVLVTMSAPEPESTVRYTTDGTEPGAMSAVYRWPFLVNVSTVVKARAFKRDWLASGTAVGVFSVGPDDAVAPPTITPGGGRFTTFQIVSATTDSTGGILRYTADGLDPDESSPVFPSGGLTIARSLPLKVRAFVPGLVPSAVRRADFVITGMLAAGGRCSYALKADGTLWGWGENNYGQLANGTTTPSYSPIPIAGPSDVMAVATGGLHTLALTRDGAVWVWGQNAYGQLGLGDLVTRWTPVKLSGVSGVVAVAAGAQHSLVLKADGTVWAWGQNSSGQIGDGTTTQRLLPVMVPGLSGVRDIAAGDASSYAIQANGEDRGAVWSWGHNSDGALGDGSFVMRTVPVRVPGISAARVVRGSSAAFAILDAGVLQGWGSNTHGQVGDTTLVDRSSPVEVPFVQGVNAVGVGSIHTVALTGRGEVWSWGNDQFQQLGTRPAVTGRAHPEPVLGVSNGLNVASGWVHTVVLVADGTIRAWGQAHLGTGSLFGSDLPVVVPDFRLAENGWLVEDPDGDGLPTFYEYYIGTDPLTADSNGDGIPDGLSADLGWEGANPDADGDGLSNAEEIQLGTDPYLADSDGDGVPDGADAFPLDPSRFELPPADPLDMVPPGITLIEPVSARPVSPP